MTTQDPQFRSGTDETPNTEAEANMERAQMEADAADDNADEAENRSKASDDN